MVRNAILRVTVGSGIVFEKNLTGMGNSKRFGVINRQTYDFFVRSGVPKDKLSIVGYLDFSLAQEMQESLDSSATKRSEVTNRLGLDLKKKRITFFSSAYNGKDVHVLSDSQQYELTLRIIKIIQDVCSKDQYEILFKIHPSENLELYRPLQNFEVKLYDKHANNYELVYFTDLYVGGGTAANFIPIVMGKEAIFVNFLNLPIIDATRKVFNIEKFVTEDKEFRKLLSFFVTGTLSPLYRSSEETVTRNSLQKILDWIDNTTQVN